MSSLTFNKGLEAPNTWSEEMDEQGRWSRRKSLLFMAIASVAFWAALAIVVLR